MEKDAAKTERKERERRRDSEGQPPPIPEKVTNWQQLEVPNPQEVHPDLHLEVGKRPL